MNEKDKFIQELRKQLAVLGIHNNVVNEIIMDMKQHFELSKLDGKSETDVILSLENPCDLAKEYLWLKDLTEKKKSVVNIYISMLRKMPKMFGMVMLLFWSDVLLSMLFVVGVMIVIGGGICIIGTIGSFFNVNGITFEGINIGGVWGTRVIVTIMGVIFIHYGYKFTKYMKKKISNANKRFISSMRKKVLIDNRRGNIWTNF